MRLHRRASDIAALQAQQSRILAALWPLLAPGGRLVYATCSLLRAENQAVVEPFLAARPEARALAIELPVGQSAGPGWQVLPGDGDRSGRCLGCGQAAAGYRSLAAVAGEQTGLVLWSQPADRSQMMTGPAPRQLLHGRFAPPLQGQ